MLLFDEIDDQPPRRGGAGDLFLNPSPLTADVAWLNDVLRASGGPRTAIVHDLIPLREPHRYLSSRQARFEYFSELRALLDYDILFANSTSTKNELQNVCGIAEEKIVVTGVAIRPSLEPRGEADFLPHDQRAHVACVGGDDPRKNMTLAALAHAMASRRLPNNIPIRLIGGASSALRQEIRGAYASAGGDARRLSFSEHMSDDELRRLLQRAYVVIVPSRAEGFSIPVIEANAAGTPVVASDIPPHAELLGESRFRFAVDDVKLLAEHIERMVLDDGFWLDAFHQQKGIWNNFSSERVCARFLEGLALCESSISAPSVSKRVRPRIALLTPLPPAQSGVANFTAAVIEPLAQRCEVHVFTDTATPHRNGSVAAVLRTNAIRHLRSAFDATVSVIGNSSHHLGAFHYLLDYGGAAVAHDARMLNFYSVLLGRERTQALARKEGYELSPSDLDRWLASPSELPTLFLSEIVAAARPLFVHSRRSADLIGALYGRAVHALPFIQYRKPHVDIADEHAHSQAKQRIGLDLDSFLLSSFGNLARDRAPEIVLWAAKFLEDWQRPVHLAFCGACEPALERHLRGFAADIGLRSRVEIFPAGLSEDSYDEYLLASDAAVQLRTYGFGQCSGGLHDCIVAGLPSVSNSDLADALEAPSFVRRIDDDFSPLLVAEAVLELMGRGDLRRRSRDEADAYARQHSPARYADLLLSELGLDPATSSR